MAEIPPQQVHETGLHFAPLELLLLLVPVQAMQFQQQAVLVQLVNGAVVLPAGQLTVMQAPGAVVQERVADSIREGRRHALQAGQAAADETIPPQGEALLGGRIDLSQTVIGIQLQDRGFKRLNVSHGVRNSFQFRRCPSVAAPG